MFYYIIKKTSFTKPFILLLFIYGSKNVGLSTLLLYHKRHLLLLTAPHPFDPSPKSLGLCPPLGTLPLLGLTSGLIPPTGLFAVVIFIKKSLSFFVSVLVSPLLFCSVSGLLFFRICFG